MKKKLILGVFALVAGTVVHLKGSSSFNSSDLAELLKLNEAQASCGSTVINNGRCSAAQNCFGNPGGPVDCDTTRSY